MPQIIGVQFQRAGKIYYFDSENLQIESDTYVIVETSRGIEYARVALDTHWIPEEDLDQPLKPIIRVANEEDAVTYQENLVAAKEAYDICQEKIQLCDLDMKLVNVEYTFDRAKVIFNFTADERVDFRELIKELAAVFHTRIELRQIGVRDEAKIVGGVGICGQPLCCHRFLIDFSPVSIKMAKEQNLSLNPTKISGCCGRLLCCLNYENEHYVESNRLAREQAKAEKHAQEHQCDQCPAALAQKEQPAAPDHEDFDHHDDDTTEITVETYYDPSLVQSTVDAMKHDNTKKRSHHDKDTHEKRSNHAPKDNKDKKSAKNGEHSNRPKKTKRPHDGEHAEDPAKKDNGAPSAADKSDKPRKPRKRGSRGGRNRNKTNAKPKQPSNE